MSKEQSGERNRLLVFGGTAEGRQVSDYLCGRGARHVLCVATEYGEEVLSPHACRQVRRGRMDQEQIYCFLQNETFAAVIDATHPYAVEVSHNVRAACARTGVSYLRYLRPRTELSKPQGEFSAQEHDAAGLSSAETIPEKGCAEKKDAGSKAAEGKNYAAERESDIVWVSSAAEAADYLENRQGTVFLTTGSKELHVFTERLTDVSRLFARVLPSPEVIAACRALGLEGKQICGMQGPFSAEINEAMMRQTQASFLVTKDTGKSGGFPEKLEAARRLGVCAVVIRRPEDSGYDWEQLKAELERFVDAEPCETADGEPAYCMDAEPHEAAGGEATHFIDEDSPATDRKRVIHCVGIGMGTPETLTQEAAAVIRAADVLFGAKRILASAESLLNADAERLPETAEMPSSEKTYAGRPAMIAEYMGEKIAAWLREHPGYSNIVILMSGDVGFYSGARALAGAFPGEQIHYHCGISSVVYFAARVGTAWQDAKLLSAHGKPLPVLNCVRRYPKIILLVSGKADVERICGELAGAGQEQVRVTVGSSLSYPQESVRSGCPADFIHCETEGLHIMLLENPQAGHVITPGIADDRFVRGKVPMTKEEVRILSIARLRLTEQAVVYDVGAGTGSVSVEIARLCTEGVVYAIERNPEGIALIRENSARFCVSNVVAVEGLAPQALEPLPPPTHAFIGGSAGNMKEIVLALRAKNPQVRIVLNVIALESVAEVTALLKELEIEDADIIQVSVSKARRLGRYHMPQALNPVYIVSFGGEPENIAKESV